MSRYNGPLVITKDLVICRVHDGRGFKVHHAFFGKHFISDGMKSLVGDVCIA